MLGKENPLDRKKEKESSVLFWNLRCRTAEKGEHSKTGVFESKCADITHTIFSFISHSSALHSKSRIYSTCQTRLGFIYHFLLRQGCHYILVTLTMILLSINIYNSSHSIVLRVCLYTKYIYTMNRIHDACLRITDHHRIRFQWKWP